MRRFIGPQEYDGTPLNFIGFNLNETFELYNQYRLRWLDRRMQNKDITQELYTKLSNNPDWPITKDAIVLAWRATSKTPSALQEIFQDAVNFLRSRHKDDFLNHKHTISLKDMAELIHRAHSRPESDINLTEKKLIDEVMILKSPGDYFDKGIAYQDGDNKIIVEIIADIIRTSFENFTVDAYYDGDKYSVFTITDPLKNSIKIGIFFQHNMTITTPIIKKFYDYTSDNNSPENVTFILVIKSPLMKQTEHGVYCQLIPQNFINGNPKFGESGYKRHLGNYTYLMDLGDGQLNEMLSCYKQKNADYYTTLTSLLDQRCGIIELNIPLSEVIRNVLRYINPKYVEGG
jgi:hypothetical protein